ncbi:hypothetical protein CPT_Sansa91 [Caulobacter phage Sansa]|uniref:Uncharacterized protein n=1 Tax=Caulobacter phage Sansa TaxID=1675600 RepID=A0A0K1LMZ3_9CAUD|nr:hypothetical protein HOR07_gp091 [Caulobacter phage Sansa]AKU43495.1 hypothetical protein CPT_Sansa91 [Caulobacter phage Sansa]
MRNLRSTNRRRKRAARKYRSASWMLNILLGRHTAKAFGDEEGDICGRPGCVGMLWLERDPGLGGCSCFRSAPCSSCMSEVPACRVCGWRGDPPE